MADRGDKSGFGGAGLGIGAAVAVVVCCAAPLLVAGGVFAGGGVLLRSGWPFLLAGAALVTAIAVTLWRRQGRRDDGAADHSPADDGDCCAPPHSIDHNPNHTDSSNR